jgi:hypothetical protein
MMLNIFARPFPVENYNVLKMSMISARKRLDFELNQRSRFEKQGIMVDLLDF